MSLSDSIQRFWDGNCYWLIPPTDTLQVDHADLRILFLNMVRQRNKTVLAVILCVEGGKNYIGELKKDGYQLHLKLPDAVDEEGSAENVVGFLPGKDPTKAVSHTALPSL